MISRKCLYFFPFIFINWRLITLQYCSGFWTIKLLEENIGKTLSDINHSRILYDPPPRILEIKAKISKWDLMKLKSFCTAKESISKVKRQPSDWEKITANEAKDRGLISKLHKQLLLLNSRKVKDPSKVSQQISFLRTDETEADKLSTLFLDLCSLIFKDSGSWSSSTLT